MPGLNTSQQQTTGSGTQSYTPADISQIMAGVNGASGALSTAAANVKTPTGFTAQMTPQQLQAYQNLYNTSSGLIPSANSTIAPSASLVNSGASGIEGALSGYSGFNPSATNNIGNITQGANAYTAGQNIPAEVQNAMLAGTQEARDVINPATVANAGVTGNTNSSRAQIQQGLVDRGLAEQAAGLSGSLQSQAEATGANLASNTLQSNNAASLAALSGMYNAGASGVGTGSGALSSGINNYGALSQLSLGGAGGAQTNQQLGFTNQLQADQYGETNPFTPYANYLGILGGVNAGGSGTSTNNSTTTSTPSAMSTIASLLGAGGSLLGASPSQYSGGSGLLGAGINPFSWLT